MAIFAVNGACGACKASVLAMATSHVSSVSLKRAVSFNGGRSSRMLQVRSKSLNRRGINHSCPPAHLQRSRLGKLAADSGLTWKRSAGHSTITASISVPPYRLPMTDHLLVLKGNEGEARQEINSRGGHILHWFGDSIFVATLGDGPDINPLTKPLTTASPLPEDWKTRYSITTLGLIQAWIDSQSIELSPQDDGKYWDAPGMMLPGASGEATMEAQISGDAPIPPTKIETKDLSGKMGLLCIVVSGDSTTAPELQFGPTEIANTYAQIVSAATFWSKAEPMANIEWDHTHRSAQISVANDVSGNQSDYEDRFKVPALKALATEDKLEPAGSTYNSVSDLLKASHLGGMWSCCVFVTKYNLVGNSFAYAYKGGQEVYLKYANDGWGPDMLGRTFAHETGHLFGAQDEYGNCDCAKNDLYEVQINGNCVNCVNKPKKICIMKQNALGWICPYTRGEVGWEWWGYSSPFDGPTTNTSPALASDGTKLYLAWKGDGTDGVQIRDSDDQGKTWGPPTPLGAMTKAGTGPRLVFFKGEFYMAFVGLEDNRIKVKRSANGTDWGDSSQIDTGETSDFEPSLTVFQDALYMAYRVAGGSNKIRIISSEYGRSWNEPVELPSEFRSRVAPALCALPGNEPVVKSTLFLAFQTTDRPQFIRVYTSTDGTTFGNGVTATVNHSPREGPALSALGNGRMYMVFPTTDYGPDFPEGDVIPRAKGAPPADQGESTADGGRVGPLMYLSSGADNNWSRSGPRFLPEGMLGDSCTDQTPSLVEFGPLDDDWPKGGLLMAFKGVGGKVLNMVRMGRALVY